MGAVGLGLFEGGNHVAPGMVKQLPWCGFPVFSFSTVLKRYSVLLYHTEKGILKQVIAQDAFL